MRKVGIALMLVLVLTGLYVWNVYTPDYDDELDLSACDMSELQEGCFYRLDAGSYQIESLYGSHVIGDANQLDKQHQTNFWGVELDSGMILVGVVDNQAKAFSRGDNITLHGILTGAPDVLDRYPDESVQYCLYCPDDGSDRVFGVSVSMCVLMIGLLVIGVTCCWPIKSEQED